ncbi:MAG TPA: hypothetical protein PK349_03020 [Candidatus Hydrogenedentes bacterium]|nr:hypothetical protein [Candidatus Hydrogenedentota bacterium]
MGAIGRTGMAMLFEMDNTFREGRHEDEGSMLYLKGGGFDPESGTWKKEARKMVPPDGLLSFQRASSPFKRLIRSLSATTCTHFQRNGHYLGLLSFRRTKREKT